MVRTYTYGNVAFIQLDGNDLSAEISENNGYTGGQQTNWLLAQLATYRAGTTVDFVVVYFHNCMYCTNGTHGSDGGVRNVWQPIFDNWNVDLVINGHVHAYERSQPLFNNAPVKQVAGGGSYTNFYTDQGRPYSAVGGDQRHHLFLRRWRRTEPVHLLARLLGRGRQHLGRRFGDRRHQRCGKHVHDQLIPVP